MVSATIVPPKLVAMVVPVWCPHTLPVVPATPGVAGGRLPGGAFFLNMLFSPRARRIVRGVSKLVSRSS